jgi:4-hydroxythreonine-4-phosphate dehydrogenase
MDMQKPIIGISCGDLNGIGLELVIKTFSDPRMFELCTPVLFASHKAIQFYRKNLTDFAINFQQIKDFSRLNLKQLNVMNCWEDEVAITPGVLNEIGGQYAIKSLEQATEALRQGHIQGLITAPIHKKNVQSEHFQYSGHTPYLKHVFNAPDVLMFMVADNMRVGLVTEHVSIAALPKHLTKAAILSKLKIMKESLIKDFGIDKPKIAVLGMNPHAGDEGLIGNEEEEIIKPAIKEFKQQPGCLVFGPYSADAFFARGQHERFDGILAMYHDQGLIPFKSLAMGEAVNYTAGLPVVRTSPDHGTAFDIAGKNKADQTSFIAAIYKCIDIIHTRADHQDRTKNPLRRASARFLANAVDERIEE